MAEKSVKQAYENFHKTIKALNREGGMFDPTAPNQASFAETAKTFAEKHGMLDPTHENYDSGSHTHQCIHGKIRRRLKDNPPHVVNVSYVGDGIIHPHHGKRRVQEAVTRDMFQRIRIHFDTRYVNDERTCKEVGQMSQDHTLSPHKCSADDVLTPEKAKFMVDFLEQAHDYLRQTFAVIPVDGPLKVDHPEENCGVDNTVPLPQDHIFQGVPDTDIIIYVATWPAGADLAIRAYAAPCVSDQYGRPIAGIINFPPNKLEASVSSFPTAVHELFHVFGFIAYKYPDFRDANLQLLKPHHIIDIQLGKETVQEIKTERVVQRARWHFNCDRMQGLAVEDYFADTGSHWEKLIMGNDLMTAELAPRFPPLSTITLALFEDSHWYVTNYARAGQFDYGASLGCTFVLNSCASWGFDGYGSCPGMKSDVTDCAFDQNSYGRCRDSKFTEPCTMPDTTVACLNGNGDFERRMVTKSPFDVYGESSKCFVADVEGTGDTRAHCFRYECVDGGILRVFINNKAHVCVDERKIIKTNDGGELHCPAYRELCGVCPGGIQPVRGRCTCPAGKEGAQCEIVLPDFAAVDPPGNTPIALNPATVIKDFVPPPPESPGGFDTVTVALIGGGAVVYLLICIAIVWLGCTSNSNKGPSMDAAYEMSARPAALESWETVRADPHREPKFGVGHNTRNSHYIQNHQQQPSIGDLRSSKVDMRAKYEEVPESQVQVLFEAEALWDCRADSADELSFAAGDILEVLGDFDELWWYCRRKGESGNVPAQYLKVLDPGL